MSKDSNREYITISMIAIIAALIGTLAISQVLQPLPAQNTSGQMSQKLGNVSGAAANKTGNQSSNPLAKIPVIGKIFGGK
jgi:hypothetical protein